MTDDVPNPTPDSAVQRWRGPRVSGYFFDELKSYIEFDEDVEQRLMAVAPVVEPHADAVVQSFYTALESNPRTRAVFTGPAQVERLKTSLHGWLLTGLRGPWDDAFFAHRSHIGEVHVQVGLLPHFMNGAMNIVRRHICRLLDADEDLTVEHNEAVASWLDLELTIMLQAYWDYMMKRKLQMPLALATGLAHEIRNPLNAIGLNLTLLERKLNDENREMTGPILSTVRGEIARINDLTTEIMDFAKPVALIPQWHSIDAMLDELRATLGPTFDAVGVTFETTLEGDPDLYCDKNRMRQALFNLLTNAVEATEPGGAVSLKVINSPNGTTIAVSDTGEGMEPSTVYHIFDLFFTQKASGTGLGLPIVKNIVEAHGGTIEVVSRPRRGTTFSIRLPRPARSPNGDDDGGTNEQ